MPICTLLYVCFSLNVFLLFKFLVHNSSSHILFITVPSVWPLYMTKIFYLCVPVCSVTYLHTDTCLHICITFTYYKFLQLNIYSVSSCFHLHNSNQFVSHRWHWIFLTLNFLIFDLTKFFMNQVNWYSICSTMEWRSFSLHLVSSIRHCAIMPCASTCLSLYRFYVWLATCHILISLCIFFSLCNHTYFL